MRTLVVTVLTVVGLVMLTGPGSAQERIRHRGDNEAEISQRGSAGSGDAVAGSSVTGIVASGDVSVRTVNVSEDASARSGDATVSNSVSDARVGPVVQPGPGAGAAQLGAAAIAHRGDNEGTLEQSGNAVSGDCTAGAVITGVVAGGSVSVDKHNTSKDDSCVSGEAIVTNVGTLLVGPVVELPGLEPAPREVADLAVSKEFSDNCDPPSRDCLIFAAVVENLGPGTARDVVFTDQAEPGWVVDEITVSGDFAENWDCTGEGTATATCEADVMDFDHRVTIFIRFRWAGEGAPEDQVTNTATVAAGGSDDPEPGNNIAEADAFWTGLQYEGVK